MPEIKYTSYIPARAVLGRKFVVAAKCSIKCTAKATARIKIGRNRSRKEASFIRLKPVSRTLAAGVRGNLVLLIPSGRIPGMRKAIRNGSRVTAPVVVRMVGEDSSGGSGAGTTRFFPRKRG